jgi:hypothetical protein
MLKAEPQLSAFSLPKDGRCRGRPFAEPGSFSLRPFLLALATEPRKWFSCGVFFGEEGFEVCT